MRLIFGAAVLSTAAIAGAAQAQDASPKWELSATADYSVGKYGAAVDTKYFDAPLDAKVQIDRLRLEAAVPYVSVEGPGEVVGGVVVVQPGSTVTSRRSGLGDVVGTAGYLVHRDEGGLPALELSGSAKFATAKKSIGTGENDYSVRASVYKGVASGVTLFGVAGYEWLGDPANFALENGALGSAGLDYKPADDMALGLSVNYHQRYAKGYDDQVTLSPYISHRIGAGAALTLYGTAGTNSSSPRAGGGLKLTFFR
jgi:hypothetical protein